MAALRPLLAADILAEGLDRFADIEYTDLGETAGRLEQRRGQRPVLWLDVEVTPEDLCRVLSEALLVLSGAGVGTSARRVRRLSPVP